MARLSDYSGNERVSDESAGSTTATGNVKTSGCGGIIFVLAVCFLTALGAGAFWFFEQYEMPGETDPEEVPVFVEPVETPAAPGDAVPASPVITYTPQTSDAPAIAPQSLPKKVLSDKQFSMTVRSNTEQFVKIRQRSAAGQTSVVFAGKITPGVPETLRAGGEITVSSPDENIGAVSIEIAGSVYTAPAGEENASSFSFVPEE